MLHEYKMQKKKKKKLIQAVITGNGKRRTWRPAREERETGFFLSLSLSLVDFPAVINPFAPFPDIFPESYLEGVFVFQQKIWDWFRIEKNGEEQREKRGF